MNWFEELMSRDRRKAPRHEMSWLAAYCWNGGPPEPQVVRDISTEGLYLLTTDRWYPGTLITLRLQRRRQADKDVPLSIMVQGRVVRSGPDGVALAFVLLSAAERKQMQAYVGADIAVADRNLLERFLLTLFFGDQFGSVE